MVLVHGNRESCIIRCEILVSVAAFSYSNEQIQAVDLVMVFHIEKWIEVDITVEVDVRSAQVMNSSASYDQTLTTSSLTRHASTTCTAAKEHAGRRTTRHDITSTQVTRREREKQTYA